MRTLHTLTLAALTTLAWASPASAAVEPDPASIDKLRECVVQYTKEQFAEALVLCKESLSIQRNAATLLTIAKTYEKLGKCDIARDFADQSVAQVSLALDQRGREKADAFLEKLPDSEYCAAPEEPAPTVEQRRFGWMSYVGAGALVLGAGGAGAGMYFGMEAERELGELEDADSQTSYDSTASSIASNQSLGQALLLSGAGLAAVGLALVVVDAATVEEVEVAPVVFAPVLGPDRVGAAMFMRF